MDKNEYQEGGIGSEVLMGKNEDQESGTGSDLPIEKNDHESGIGPAIHPEWPVRYAGFWMRFWAYLLDLIVVGSIERILVNPLFRALDISLAEFNMFAPVSIASAIIFYVYFVLMTKYFNQTLGKMVFGIKVVNVRDGKLSWGTILFREWIGRFISATIVVGYIIVAFLPKKQGLHDLFSDTTVIHVDR